MIPKMEEIEEKIQALETKVAYLEQGVERKKRSETITSILCLAVVVINILSTSHTHINTQRLMDGTEEVISGYEDLGQRLGGMTEMIEENDQKRGELIQQLWETVQSIEGQYDIQDKKSPNR